MSTTRSSLERARAAFDQRSWRAARELLAAARERAPLEPSDLRRLAVASYLMGEEDDFLSAMQELHRAHLAAGEPAAAVRPAFWLGLHLATRGDMAQASGWFSRAARLLEGTPGEGVEHGYVLLPEGYQQLMTGQNDDACRTAAAAARIAQRHGDGDLLALALHLHGRARLRQGRVAEGLALLDEAMIGVTADELLPQVTGLVYCSVISACWEVWALGRAHEWTAALTEWCSRQPDMVAYTDECRVYRAEILTLRGEWPGAIDEARRAAGRPSAASHPKVAGHALYLEGEVHRLRGEQAAAETAYRGASQTGYEPQPGLALLRLAQGDVAAAAAASRRALAETPDRRRRARLLPAHIEIMLQSGEIEEARTAAVELAEAAGCCAPGVLETLVAQARGAIALAADTPDEALAPLREAWRAWQALDAPYEAARARLLLGQACRALGDEEGAALELEAARAAFERLGAAPDLARAKALLSRAATRGRGRARGPHGLTPREREVLAQLATGRTNRAIAATLSISEKTVARHVANIFLKLGLSTRAAATAYAYEHGLVRPPA